MKTNDDILAMFEKRRSTAKQIVDKKSRTEQAWEDRVLSAEKHRCITELPDSGLTRIVADGVLNQFMNMPTDIGFYNLDVRIKVAEDRMLQSLGDGQLLSGTVEEFVSGLNRAYTALKEAHTQFEQPTVEDRRLATSSC